MNKSLYSKDHQYLVEKLKECRIEAGYTQTQVAKKLNVTQAYISKIENGQVRLDIFQLRVFAKLYKKDFGEFIWLGKKQK